MNAPATQIDRPYLDFNPAKPLPLVPVTQAVIVDLPAIPIRNVAAATILDCVAQAYLIASSDLRGRDRHKSVAEARKVAYWLFLELTTASFPEIGRALCKDHSSARSGVLAVERQRAADPAFRAFTDELAAAVKARIDIKAHEQNTTPPTAVKATTGDH